MKVAIIGTRNSPKNIAVDILKHVPAKVTEIVSGGACGVDTAAEQVAKVLCVPVKVFLPDYTKFGRAAPIQRNKKIIEYADIILAFWDGQSKGTQDVIVGCLKTNKPVKIILIED